MSNPTVCAVALYGDRPQFIGRMLESFRAQTYPEKWLLIYDNGQEPFEAKLESREVLIRERTSTARTIGELRNAANLITHTDVIAHWDVDDWSHPNRIADQVALLQESGKECVGYRDLLFWSETPAQFCGAWIYTNAQPSYCLGTSLCYWRKTWERRPFEALPKGPMGMGEDHQWLSGVDSMGIPSTWEDRAEPRMIASVHGSNSTDIMCVAIQVKDKMLRRTPEFDSYCRERMALGSRVVGKFTEERAL